MIEGGGIAELSKCMGCGVAAISVGRKHRQGGWRLRVRVSTAVPLAPMADLDTSSRAVTRASRETASLREITARQGMGSVVAFAA